MRLATSSCSQSGVTLVEMIVSIVVAGVLVALVGMFGRWQIQSYFDVSSRAALTDTGDTALRRIAREIQSALPNSVRVNTTLDDGTVGDGTLLEFVPVIDAGRYRADFTLSGTGNPLEFALSPTDTIFDVLGPPVSVSGGQFLVVYNLGQPNSNVYDGSSRRGFAATGANLSSLSFVAGPGQFPLASPANRFHIVATPVSFQCDIDPLNNRFRVRRHWNYGFMPIQAATAAGLLGSTSSTLVEHVVGCTFTYTPGALQRNGLITISLTLSDNGETVNLLHQIEVLNSP